MIFQHPGQPEHKFAHSRYSEAEDTASEVNRRDGTATIYEAQQDGSLKKLAEFGPDIFHWFERVSTDGRPLVVVCRCGKLARDSYTVTSHMSAAGKCDACWGEETVSERAESEGKPMAGNTITCPVCGGSGRSEDVSYHDVDVNSYYSRLQELELKGS
ncbi:hypothetical protein AB0G15_05755 [Streptosporangium sp. NPDC023825]|uniref:hypothetical protein n=1 Tax=Streptosporangium sp. NPDC023825 TaxID=3154909 RepID=UPI00342D3192